MEIIVVLAVVALIVRFAASLSTRFHPPTQDQAGEQGESKVAYELHKLAGGDYRVFNGVILKAPDGTTQVDHIVISSFGIFVIETKNLKGWIFGGERQKQWTQCLIGSRTWLGGFGSEKHQFSNPIHQNYKHIMAVQSLLGIHTKRIFNVVVFVGDSEFKTNVPENVLELHELVPYIKLHMDKIVTEAEFEDFSAKLDNHIECLKRLNFGEDQHIENIEINKSHPLCPRCGKAMILRAATRGSRAGSNFWGCPSFPRCGATKSIEV